MFKRCILVMAGTLALSGCADKSAGPASNASAALTGQVMALAHGTITGVRQITIQNDSGSNHRLKNTGGAVVGESIQSGMVRINSVELFIRPDNGSDFTTVQSVSEGAFVVGQRVNIISHRGQVIITPTG